MLFSLHPRLVRRRASGLELEDKHTFMDVGINYIILAVFGISISLQEGTLKEIHIPFC